MSVMNNNNQRAFCQQLWVKNKDLVLSHSSKTYQEIRQYLKNGQVELIELENMIVHTCQIPEHGG